MPQTTTPLSNGQLPTQNIGQLGIDGNPTSPSVSTPSPISVTGLNSNETAYQASQPSPTPIPDISTLQQQLTSSYTPTPQESKETNLSTLLAGLNEQESGKSAFESNLAQSQGLTFTTDANGNPVYNDPGLIDLNTKLTALQNQAQGIPLTLQNSVQGAGVTDAGLAPQQTAALRNNAIQALTVSSLIAAKQGQLQTAQLYINNAVQQKYGPVEAQIKALSQNLDLVKNDPNTTLEEQQRATYQQSILQQEQARIDADKTNYINTQQTVAQYAPVATPAQLSQLATAQTPAQLSLMAQQMGLLTPEQQAQQLSIRETAGQIAQQPTDLALKMAQLKQANAIASAYTNPAFISGVQNGSIPVNNLNSRTLPIYSALASANAGSTNPINITQLSTNEAAAKKVITNLQTQAATIEQAGGALQSNIKLLAGLSDKVNGLGIPKVANITNALKAQYSNQPDVVNYLNVLNTVRSEYAKYVARGGQVDDSVRSEAANAIPAGVDGATLTSLYNTLKTEGDNVQQSIKDAQSGEWQNITGSSTQGGTSSSNPLGI